MATAAAAGEPEPQFGQTILFTAKPEILAAEACNVYNFSRSAFFSLQQPC